MPIQVQRPGARGGSVLTNILGMFNTAHGSYSAMKGGGAKNPDIQYTTGAYTPGENLVNDTGALGGKEMAGQLGSQADAFGAEMSGLYGAGAAGADAAAAGDAAGFGAAGGGAAAEGGASAAALLAYKGGIIPGQDQYRGDSPKNDTVKARVSPGEMVIPRTVVEEGPESIQKFALEAIHRRMAR